jgi:hypothetical protein
MADMSRSYSQSINMQSQPQQIVQSMPHQSVSFLTIQFSLEFFNYFLVFDLYLLFSVDDESTRSSATNATTHDDYHAWCTT